MMKTIKIELWILCKTFQGIPEGVEVYLNEAKAIFEFQKYTDHKYPENEEEWEAMDEDYSDCRIFKKEITIRIDGD